MTPKSFPSYPALPSLRLAAAADVTRMADLSVLGFKDSEIFRYERPQYKEFPQDTVASFANLYRSQLLDPRSVVVVAEDWQRPDEASHFSPSKNDSPGHTDTPAKRVVVGVASWILPEGSPRTGQFVVPDVGDPEPAPDRDLCQRRLNIVTRVKETGEKTYFTGMSICDKLVIHPSYRRRGHTTFMLQWGLRLCDIDAINQGVIPSHMGEPVYVGFGYEVVGEIHTPNDGEVDGFSQRVVVYKAERGPTVSKY